MFGNDSALRSAGFLALHFHPCTAVYYLLIRSYLALSPALRIAFVELSRKRRRYLQCEKKIPMYGYSFIIKITIHGKN